ncbi:30S ribosomal protein S12 methylthiotransferase RimO [Helicobacter saguini]|uniref:Ribosomal protein uS12 methylthiotransferase RimO n=1 Tax=Helicobacter saguini TaxID=1548018 RepID=A0A347W5C5_9HELI|nr:30S ribosomal protein S12 methylthiotransferase RimO [Helicobacter saguini]MWV61505.1 30S ribosomal protein S12 methylthiotransferase RimO [Helicobacter saguini]MWV67825.1 30S ribosomal protein S12 methylthiotransferase RimO [Helicobacter saguini]MWV70707.1 30S ribosomal protein S12 methylthiotransferase RimO [Helicobacter saguini]MWV72611.1 30S ribosomal protein S12 methylthiotransferase RimO [Helicobacter saguini]TLD94580.1 30S ribosomal protein S12 methylthiotransferase RimO [Helicobacte
MKKVHVISLGCSKNLVDSEVMLGRLCEYEITSEIKEADVIIINTCGFIEAAKSESLGHIFEALNVRKKGALLVASGCLIARYAQEIKKLIPEIDIMTGVGDFNKIDSMIESKITESKRNLYSKNTLDSKKDSNIIESKANFEVKKDSKNTESKGVFIESKRDSKLDSKPQPKVIISSNKVFLNDNEKRVITGSKIHAYVKISEGCNQSCSFCAIPTFKGKLQSRSIDSILKELENLATQGFQDISFIAQDTSSFLLDLGVKNGLLKLINAVEAQGAIKTARILYLYPSSTDFALLDSIANSEIFQNYFDMPIQHISQRVLRDMNRSYKDVRFLLDYMKKIPNAFVRSSVIVGYPTESESDFEELCEFLSDYKFDRLNVFEYSSEEGTRAGLLKELPKMIRTKRINKIKRIIAKNQKELFKSMLGQVFPCIIEGKSEVSPMFLSSRDVRWGREIDGEILINDVSFSLLESLGNKDSKNLQAKDSNISQGKDSNILRVEDSNILKTKNSNILMAKDSKNTPFTSLDSMNLEGYFNVKITESKDNILVGKVVG